MTECERECVSEAQVIAVTACQNQDVNAGVRMSPGEVTAQARPAGTGRSASTSSPGVTGGS